MGAFRDFRAMFTVLLLFLSGSPPPFFAVDAQQVMPSLQPCFDVPTPSPGRDLPLCGNGALDAGEICDDGNRLDGDGCSAFCTHFDGLTNAATLAGSTASCPNGITPILNGPTSSVIFCNLRALDAALDGSYVLLADGNKLLRFDLFTDRTENTIVQLSASITTNFRSLCSIGILAPDATIMLHDCGASQFYAAMRDGTREQMVADLSAILQPPVLNLKSFYDRAARRVVTAGIPVASLARNPDAAEGSNGNTVIADADLRICVMVYTFAITEFHEFYVQSAAPLARIASIPCTLYGVWERGAQLTSFDARGMHPYLVTREQCPSTFRAGQRCYCVYLHRVTHMEYMRAYIPEDGGIDIQYYASTSTLYDNALGPPLVRFGGGGAGGTNNLVYTLKGACMQLESRTLTPGGRAPPPATLGNICRRAPMLGPQCTLPLNNPFITDVMTSPVLPPEGLSVTHTHAELSAIFSSSCSRLANVTSAGPLLYRSVLSNVYGNTTPVDFVELPNTLDIVYVTPTSVGLISTKRILFQDRAQPGYARATNLIYCPRGYFGFVGTVCALCNDTAASGYYVSVAWQIQCVSGARGGGNAVSPPYETFTVITTRNVTGDDVRTSACIYSESKGSLCPSSDDFTMLTPQQFNLAADTLESRQQSASNNNMNAQRGQEEEGFIACLIRSAEENTGRTIRRADSAEYSTRIVSMGDELLRATDARTLVDPASANYSEAADIAPALASACLAPMVRGLGNFLTCAAQHQGRIATDARRRRRRNLLQQETAIVAEPQLTIEHHGVTMGSSTIISWSRTLPPGFNPNSSADISNGDSNGGGGLPSQFPLIFGAVLGSVCAVVAVYLFYIFYKRRSAVAVVRAALPAVKASPSS